MKRGVHLDASNIEKSKLSTYLKHRNAAIHWFQNGHPPMKSWITDSEEMLGVSEKQAEKFSRGWYNIKRQETSALWAQRQDIPKGDGISMAQLRKQVAEAVKAKRARKAKTRTNEECLKMSRKQLEHFLFIFWWHFLEQERRSILGSSITVCNRSRRKRRRKGKTQARIVHRKDGGPGRARKKRATKRKTRRKLKLKRKMKSRARDGPH